MPARPILAKAGRSLADLHASYEAVDIWPDLEITRADRFDGAASGAYHVEKMRHPSVTNPDDPQGRKIDDRPTIVYNRQITIAGIPERAHDYRLGARSAIDWIVETYRVRTDATSGIVNDPNNWAIEQDDPTYILDLVGPVVTVPMRTLDIVDGLPNLHL